MRSALLLVFAATLHAHVVSTSYGYVRIEGLKLTYNLRIPSYEVEHVTDPDNALLAEVSFKGASLLLGACRNAGEEFLCQAEYVLEAPVTDTLEAQITLHRATVPNHIHLLSASNAGNTAQEIFDQVTPLRELHFRPPSLFAQLWRDIRAGATQLLTSVPALLFLAVLALSGRTRKEAFGLANAFLLGECLVLPVAGYATFSPEFLDAMLALTAAYLAAEILWLPDGKARWVIVPVLGMLHGLPLAPYPGGYLAGAIAVQALLLAALAFADFTKVRNKLAMLLLIAALAWFTRAMFF